MFTTTFAKTYSQLENLPMDTKKLVLQYLNMKDLLALESSSKTLQSDISSQNEIWANMLEREFISIIPEHLEGYDGNPFGSLNQVPKSMIRYGQINGARQVIKQFIQSNNEWRNLFTQITDSSDAIMIAQIMEGLQCPNLPCPVLKKDIHYFATQTTYQNFLTEVQFGVQAHSAQFSPVTKAIQKVCDSISVEDLIPEEIILALRWYKIDDLSAFSDHHQKNTAFKPFPLNKSNNAIKKSKYADAIKPTLSKHSKTSKEADKNAKKKSKPKKKKQTMNIKSVSCDSPSLHEIFEQIKLNSPASIDTFDDEEFFGQISIPDSPFSDEMCQIVHNRQPEQIKQKNAMVAILTTLHQLIKSECQVVLPYLLSFTSAIGLLNEYQRAWERFALSIIDLNNYLHPIADKLNQLHDTQLPNHPNFPDFSIWRMMAKTWVKEVFMPLKNSLFQAFRVTSFKARTQSNEKLAMILDQHNHHQQQQFQNQSNITIVERIFGQELTQNFEDTHAELNNVEDSFELLKGFYDSICDISFNEYSVFYWDCLESSSNTSKAMLDTLLIQDSESIFKACQELAGLNHNTFLEALESDLEFGERFNYNELHCQLVKKQVAKMNQILGETAENIIDQHQQEIIIIPIATTTQNDDCKEYFSSSGFSSSSSSSNSHSNYNAVNNDNCFFNGNNNNGNGCCSYGLHQNDSSSSQANCAIWNILQRFINPQNLPQNINGQAIEQIISSKYKFIGDLLVYQDKFSKNADILEENINDLRKERQYRSFNIVDEKYDIYFINEIWPELRNIKDSISEKMSIVKEQQVAEDELFSGDLLQQMGNNNYGNNNFGNNNGNNNNNNNIDENNEDESYEFELIIVGNNNANHGICNGNEECEGEQIEGFANLPIQDDGIFNNSISFECSNNNPANNLIY